MRITVPWCWTRSLESRRLFLLFRLVLPVIWTFTRFSQSLPIQSRKFETKISITLSFCIARPASNQFPNPFLAWFSQSVQPELFHLNRVQQPSIEPRHSNQYENKISVFIYSNAAVTKIRSANFSKRNKQKFKINYNNSTSCCG